MMTTPSPPIPSSSYSSPSYSISSDDSIDPELSFEYEMDEDGNIIRLKKQTQKSPSSRPNSPPKGEPKKTSAAANAVAALGSAVRRLSLSRSGSLPEEGFGSSHQQQQLQARTLQRVNSGPLNNFAAVTPAPSIRAIAPFSGGLRGTGRKLGGALRIRREDAERQRREAEEEAQKEREMIKLAQEEKENNIEGYIEDRRSPPGVRPVAALPVSTTFIDLFKSAMFITFDQF